MLQPCRLSLGTRRFCTFSTVSVVATTLIATASASIVDVSVATDKSAYIFGDSIKYIVTATNPSAQPVTLNFNTSRQADYLVDNIFSPDDVALEVLTSRTVPANGSVSWNFFHPWSDYPLAPGSHSVAGEVVGYGNSLPTPFSVAPAAVVNDDVFLDFEHYPDGSPTHIGSTLTHAPLSSNAFIRNGVQLSSQGGSVNLTVLDDQQGAILHTPTASYPPGSNIVAIFSMPVYSVSARVGSAANESVTMFAYDVSNELIGSVTSDPVTAFPALVGPLSFDSITPIARVQWFSSVQNASVRVDDLFLNVNLAEMRGDFNGDGETNAADYTVWRNSIEQSVPMGFGADATHDGTINEFDFDVWRQHYGWSASESADSLSVPEPCSLVPLTFALIAASIYRRHRRTFD
jgi:hypothetical protein